MPERFHEWQFWESLRISRLPLMLILDPAKRRAAARTNKASDAAYVYRMHDLTFALREREVLARLTASERACYDAFGAAWQALPWRPLASYPHVCEVSEPELSRLVPFARALDRRLELRTANTPIPILYRIWKGWEKVGCPPGRERLFTG